MGKTVSQVRTVLSNAHKLEQISGYRQILYHAKPKGTTQPICEPRSIPDNPNHPLRRTLHFRLGNPYRQPGIPVFRCIIVSPAMRAEITNSKPKESRQRKTGKESCLANTSRNIRPGAACIASTDLLLSISITRTDWLRVEPLIRRPIRACTRVCTKRILLDVP